MLGVICRSTQLTTRSAQAPPLCSIWRVINNPRAHLRKNCVPKTDHEAAYLPSEKCSTYASRRILRPELMFIIFPVLLLLRPVAWRQASCLVLTQIFCNNCSTNASVAVHWPLPSSCCFPELGWFALKFLLSPLNCAFRSSSPWSWLWTPLFV